MEATAFHGASVITTIQSNNSKNIILSNYTGPTGSDISFVMADPSWIETPLYLTVLDEDHWFYYNDMVSDANTKSMVNVAISHDGIFVGHYVDDLPLPLSLNHNHASFRHRLRWSYGLQVQKEENRP